MLGLPDQAVGTIVAALIGAIIALLGLVISKEHKVSEFRQAWIDDLRADIALLITHGYAIVGASLAFQNDAERWRSAREDYLGINAASARIKLRLNPKEKPSIVLFELLKQHESFFATHPLPEPKTLIPLEMKILECAQGILKQEWVRVRSGEAAYRVTKTFAWLVTLACALALIAKLVYLFLQ